MAKERRAFSNYPELLRTRQNNRETFIADDPSFEPEQADFLNGFIGDISVLTAEDLERTPPIIEGTAERQKYQLSVGATFISPSTQERLSVATYTDLVRQIEANNGDIIDPNRVFATEFYAWTPPFDYDKHVNFGRYSWLDTGTADVQGEYVTKEVSHSKTVVHVYDGTTLSAVSVIIEDGLPAIMAAGTYVEDASTLQRYVYRSDGVSWQLLNLRVVEDVPTTFPDPVGDPPPLYYYVARTGPDYQRPVIWKYTETSGRWIPMSVVVNPTLPDIPRDDMVWEDSRLNGERWLKFFSNGTFQNLTYTSFDGPPGSPGFDGEYIYDTREYATLTDQWSRRNWWRHYEDLSAIDRASAGVDDTALRPIIEFWQGIESVSSDTRDYRNDSPVYKKYAMTTTTGEGFDTTEGTTIFEYQRGSGQDDPVLGFPLVFNDTGEFLFDLTLESDASAAIGYHYFLDTNTGLLHGIWHKAYFLTNQYVDANGLYDVPVGISSNADHEILTTASRARMLSHMIGVMSAQPGFSGSQTGQNSYRWTERDPSIGATLIDSEETQLRVLGTLQNLATDYPNAIRRMSKDYNKVLFRFTNRLTQLWDNLNITNGNGLLQTTAAEACDAVLTSLFIGRTEDFPFYHSQMGTFLETIATGGVVAVLDPNPRPIYIPPSPPRVGATTPYLPRSYLQRDGVTVLLGHEGTVIPTFGDERDLVWIELQNRFYEAVPTFYKTETATVSSRFDESNFVLPDYYGNYIPPTSIEPVEDVVFDYNTIVGPADGLRVFSTSQGVFALFSGGQWFIRQAITDDIFLNTGDGEYYIFNGLGAFLIDRWERPFAFEYTTNEFRTILRRDFERFIVFRAEDFSENTGFDEADPFTWNYRSAGVEGYYLGIYARVYNSIRPHSAPWEVMGYSIEPDWWTTSYIPDSIAPDGSPRYGSAHPMWTDFASGTVANPSGSITNPQFVMSGPIPVDSVGELLNPIAAGVVDEAKLNTQTIDDLWIFGDGAPMEQEFLNSSFYSFSVALAGYLMKNGKWVDSTWVANRVGVGDTGIYKVHAAPHVVNADTLTRPAISTRPIHLEVIDGVTQVNVGTNAWISEKINVEGGNPTVDFARVVKNTSPALVWKCSGYINEARTIISTLSRSEIPFSDIHVLLHKSQPISQNFCSGVLVQRETGGGYRVFGFDPFDPFFTIETSAVPIFGGQVLLEEDFTVEYNVTDPDELSSLGITGGSTSPNTTGLTRTFVVTEFKLPGRASGSDTAILAVLVNGQKFKDQHITVSLADNSVTIEDVVALQEGDRIAVQVLTTQSNPSTQVRQFIVKGVTFPYFTEGTGEFEQVEYGRFFETSAEVINFMIGYGRFLRARGWVFNSLSEGGSTRDWLLGAQRFARWVLDVESLWNRTHVDILDAETFYYSPIQDEAIFSSPYGQTTSVETIMNGAYGILNRQSEPVKTSGTEVTRIDDSLEVRRLDTTDPETEMFGVRVNLIEAEHAVVFSNTTRFNDIIYDPVSGLAQRTLFVDSYRTLNWRGRLEANGYILDGGQILPNFEKQAFDFTRFYDRYNSVDDPVKRELARDLYGYVPANASRILDRQRTPNVERRITSDSSQYMVPLGAADRTRFDYYRGMIQTKGTNRAIYAFTRGSTIGRDRFFINEDWAWKVGPVAFGDTQREVVRIDVERLDFRDEVQVFQFDGPINTNNNTVEILNFDRNNPDANPRWILPPSECITEDSCNLRFPISRDTDLIDVDGYRYYGTLYDQVNNISILDHVQYDPQLDKFDTSATCFINYTTPSDPARYNAGPDSAFSNERCWRDPQVGKTWWRQDRKLYLDYRAIPDYEDMAKFWGDLLYYKTTIDLTDDVVTMTLYGFVDINRDGTPINLTTALGLVDGDEVVISVRKTDQDEYNVQNQTVTVVGATTGVVSYLIETNPDEATGDPEVVFGHIDIYEWVESPVLPSDWEDYVTNLNDPTHPNGTPLNLGDPSFVEIVSLNDLNQDVTTYYFWVLNSTGDNGQGNPISSATISSRVGNPILNQIPWFAPVDENHMFIYTNGDAVLDDYAFEVRIDQRINQTNSAFVLISQGTRFFDAPDSIIDKIMDSLAQLDKQGNVVPSPLLAESEKYGSCFFPIQTIYADVDTAVDVYVEANNRLFARKDISRDEFLTGIFKLTEEQTDANPDGYWKRAAYVAEVVETDSVYETVQTIAERDRRLALDLYFDGDIVRVIESGAIDPWDDAEVPSNYRLTGSLFVEVGVDNHTVEINENIVDNAIRFRGILGVDGLFILIYNLLTKAERNNFVFSMLNEMIVQHPDPRCDWFFKTSYITTQVFTTTDKSPFVRPDEVSAIRDNILGVKAYRTKFRGDVNTVSIDEVEPFDVNILEFPDKKISLILDRLSCNKLDDCGWDKPAWDDRRLPCSTWDTQIWDLDDLGRDEFYLLGTFTGNSIITTFLLDAIFDPTLYGIKTVVKQNGTEVDADYIVVTTSHTQVFVDTVFSLSDTFTVEVYQSQGFYTGEPSYIGTTMEDTLFSPPISDYRHAVVRSDIPPTEFYTVVVGDGNTFTTTSGPWIEFYLNGVRLEQMVDYIPVFDYAAATFSAVLTVAPVPGDDIAFVFMRGCLDTNDPLGGRPEERIITEVCDSVNICVINDWTSAYQGWDTTAWDIAWWDQAPTNVGRRVFLLGIGKQETIPPGTEFFNTSEDITVTDPFVIIGTSPQSYTIAQFDLQKGGIGGFVPMTEGVEFGFVGIFNNIITTLVAEQQDFIADGVNFVYTTTAGAEVQYVFLDGVLETEGVHYTLDAGRTIITWTQPAPVIFPNNATVNAEGYVGDGFNIDFNTGQPADSLDIANMIVWQNGLRTFPDGGDWVLSGSDVRFAVAPLLDDEIITWSLGNTFSDDESAYAIDNFTASAAQTVFNTTSGGFVSSVNTWVFVAGLYQIEGTDYTITGLDQFTLLVPLAGGELVSFRTVAKGITDMDHIVFPASGTSTDVIPGLFDGQNIDRMLIFVDNDIQNGWAPLPKGPDYTILDVNPDVILWTTRQEITTLDWSGVDGTSLPTGAVPAAYFDISSTTTNYRLWFDDTSTAAPAPAGRTLSPIPFTGTESDQDISDLVQMAFAGNREKTELEWAGITGATLPTGAVPAAWFDLSSTTTTYRFWFSDGSTTAPAVTTEILIAIAFVLADTDLQIAASTAAAIDSADPEFKVSTLFTLVTVDVLQNGVVTDAVDGAVVTGVVITIVRQGSVPTLDADFVNAQNGGGTARIVEVELVTPGAVLDAVDGAVPTGVGITIPIQGNDPPTIGADISVRIIRTVQMSTTTVIDVNPNPGQTVSAQFVPFIEATDIVRYRFNGWPVGPLGGYIVNPMTPPLDTIGYDIIEGVLIFDSLPVENLFISINYNKSRPGGLPESILVRMENIVADILPDHETYDSPNGFNTFRPVGTQVIDTTTNLTYTWDGTIWNADPVPIPGARYYVTRPQQIWEWDGAAWNLLFNVGDAFTKPPVLDFPVFGEGITYGTYAFGSSLNAATEYEDAYQVMQHPGDCPP